MNVEILIADYLNPQHSNDITFLLNCYAKDPMGGGAELSTHVQKTLVSELSKIPHAFSVICYVDGEPAALANCFEAFSTFNAKPIINIHDLVVLKEFRGKDISQALLARIEDIAKEKCCCKVTLEVLEGNEIAQSAYLKFGFEGYELDSTTGKAMFWQKSLD